LHIAFSAAIKIIKLGKSIRFKEHKAIKMKINENRYGRTYLCISRTCV